MSRITAALPAPASKRPWNGKWSGRPIGPSQVVKSSVKNRITGSCRQLEWPNQRQDLSSPYMGSSKRIGAVLSTIRRWKSLPLACNFGNLRMVVDKPASDRVKVLSPPTRQSEFYLVNMTASPSPDPLELESIAHRWSLPRKQTYIPTAQEVEEVISVADPDTQDYLWTMRDTMGRMSEINNLTWDDVSLLERYVTLYTRKKRGGDLTPRKIPMTDRVHGILSRRFASRDRSKP